MTKATTPRFQVSVSRWTAVATTLAALSIVSHGLAAEPSTAAGTSGYHLAATWKPGGEGGWDCLAFDAEAQRLYVTRTDRVQVIDADKGTLLGEVTGLDGGHGTAVAPEFNRGFASSGKSGTVIVFDLKTLQPIGEPVVVGKKPDIVFYEPSTKHVFVFNGDSKDATVLDAATAKVVTTIPLGGAPEFAAADGKGNLFVNLEDKSETLVVDAKKNRVTQRWPLAPGEEPTGLSLDPVHHRLFASCHNDQMTVLDAENGKVLASPAIGKGPDGGEFDPGTGLAFASCGDGTLSVIKESTEKPGDFSVVENVKTQRGARTMTLDPKTHAVYLAAADYEVAPASAEGEKPKRPKMVPGSFAVLKFVR